MAADDVVEHRIELLVPELIKTHFVAAHAPMLSRFPATPPREVASRYASIRARIAGERVRPLSEKRLRLAQFMLNRPEDEPESASFDAWNETYPDDRYEHESNFRRDWRDAQKKLIEPDYDVFGIV